MKRLDVVGHAARFFRPEFGEGPGWNACRYCLSSKLIASVSEVDDRIAVRCCNYSNCCFLQQLTAIRLAAPFSNWRSRKTYVYTVPNKLGAE